MNNLRWNFRGTHSLIGSVSPLIPFTWTGVWSFCGFKLSFEIRFFEMKLQYDPQSKMDLTWLLITLLFLSKVGINDLKIKKVEGSGSLSVDRS